MEENETFCKGLGSKRKAAATASMNIAKKQLSSFKKVL